MRACIIRALMLAETALSFASLAPAQAQTQEQRSHGSGYFPGCANALVSAAGDCITLGSGVTLSGNILTSSGGSGGSAVRAQQYEVETPGSAPLTTSPYYLTTYAEEAGTINYARVAMLAASGGNFKYVVHIVHSGTDTPVVGLNNNGVCNGETGCPAAQLGTYASPNVVQATGSNTYVVGDQIYVSFNTVGGTFTNVSFHLSVTQ